MCGRKNTVLAAKRPEHSTSRVSNLAHAALRDHADTLQTTLTDDWIRCDAKPRVLAGWPYSRIPDCPCVCFVFSSPDQLLTWVRGRIALKPTACGPG